MTKIEPEHPPFNADAEEQCVICGETFGKDNWAHELIMTEVPVVKISTGTHYEAIIETEGGDELAHPECYDKAYAEVQANEHQTLDCF